MKKWSHGWVCLVSALAALSGCGNDGSGQQSGSGGDAPGGGGKGSTAGAAPNGGNTQSEGGSSHAGADAGGASQAGGTGFEPPAACKPPAAGEPGELDPTFDSAVKDVGYLSPEVIRIDRKGRYLVTGYTGLDGQPLLVARFTASGEPDTTFADDGMAELELSPDFAPMGFFITSDAQDRIWVGGASKQDMAEPDQAFLLRLDESGKLDPTFNAAGELPGVLLFRPHHLTADWLTEDAYLGNILVTPGGAWVAGYPPFIERVLDDGSFDSSFETTSIGPPSWAYDTLFLGGDAIQALDATGKARSDFGTDGKLELYAPGSTTNRLKAGAPIPQGPDKLLVFTSGSGGNRFARITLDGKLDESFGTDGFSEPFTCGAGIAAVGCDGLILATGQQVRPLPDPNQYCAVVLTPDGEPIAGTPAENQFTWDEPPEALEESTPIDATIDTTSNRVVFIHARTGNLHLVRVNLPR